MQIHVNTLVFVDVLMLTTHGVVATMVGDCFFFSNFTNNLIPNRGILRLIICSLKFILMIMSINLYDRQTISVIKTLSLHKADTKGV